MDKTAQEKIKTAKELVKPLFPWERPTCIFCKREFTKRLRGKLRYPNEIDYFSGKEIVEIFAFWTALKYVVLHQELRVCQKCTGEATFSNFSTLVKRAEERITSDLRGLCVRPRK